VPQATAELLQGAIAAHQRGDHSRAERLYREVLAKDKRNAEAAHYLGLLRAERGQLDEAVRLLRQAIRFGPGSADMHANLGRVLMMLNKPQDALESCHQALAIDPDHVAALTNCAGLLLTLNLPAQALPLLDRLLAHDPASSIVSHNRCIALLDLARYREALAEAEKLLTHQPNDAAAWYKKGMALAALDRHHDAFTAFDAAFDLQPDLPELEGKRLHAKMQICDWSNINDEIARLRRHVQQGKNASSPFALLTISPSPAEQLRCAQVYMRETFPASSPAAPRRKPYRHDKIRVAYVSGEFRDHAMPHLNAELFELHDKQRFTTFAVSTGPDDGSDMRARLVAAFDQFLDARTMSGEAIADWIRKKEVDILVDLSGHTGSGRTDVFLSKPAPVQINYLGFPGTLAAACMDYIIVDPALVLAEEHGHFSEKCAYLPDSYLAYDRRAPISHERICRRDAGLPDDGFVYCCFNSPFKLTPEIFGIWMRGLRQVDGSVLWLLAGGATAEGNLRREAELRDVAPDRIIFAERQPLSRHLARLRLADLVLDTLPYNAHTTAIDALWTGVPVLTCRGSTFVGRVGDSLLRAIGLGALIKTSLPDYEREAVRLGRDPAALAALRQKLQENRGSHPLFDIPRFTRHLEAAYAEMWSRHQRGHAPASFRVTSTG